MTVLRQLLSPASSDLNCSEVIIGSDVWIDIFQVTEATDEEEEGLDGRR